MTRGSLRAICCQKVPKRSLGCGQLRGCSPLVRSSRPMQLTALFFPSCKPVQKQRHPTSSPRHTTPAQRARRHQRSAGANMRLLQLLLLGLLATSALGVQQVRELQRGGCLGAAKTADNQKVAAEAAAAAAAAGRRRNVCAPLNTTNSSAACSVGISPAQADEQEARGLAGWAREKVGGVMGSVKDKIGSGAHTHTAAAAAAALAPAPRTCAAACHCRCLCCRCHTLRCSRPLLPPNSSRQTPALPGNSPCRVSSPTHCYHTPTWMPRSPASTPACLQSGAAARLRRLRWRCQVAQERLSTSASRLRATVAPPPASLVGRPRTPGELQQRGARKGGGCCRFGIVGVVAALHPMLWWASCRLCCCQLHAARQGLASCSTETGMWAQSRTRLWPLGLVSGVVPAALGIFSLQMPQPHLLDTTLNTVGWGAAGWGGVLPADRLRSPATVGAACASPTGARHTRPSSRMPGSNLGAGAPRSWACVPAQ